MGYPKLLFDNMFADATPVASNTFAGNFSAANIADMRPYTWWKANALPASLSVDSGSIQPANYALVYGHNLFTNAATVEVRGSTDNFVASNVLLGMLTPASDAPFLLEFTTANYRYWRLNITGAAGNQPAIAIAMIGAALVMPTGLPQGFDPLVRNVNQQIITNDNGHPLGTIVNFESWKQTLKFDFLAWSWLRATWQPAWRSNLRGLPFIFAWDSANYPNELQLVHAGMNYSTPHSSGSRASLQFEVSGVAT